MWQRVAEISAVETSKMGGKMIEIPLADGAFLA